MWVRKGQIYERKFYHELGEALKTLELLKKAGRTGATLRCCNVGHPPPEHLLRDPVVDVVKKGGKRFKRTRYVNRMRELNARGIWWCPYCMKLRRFERRVDEGRYQMYCPMCDISTRDRHVWRWNPQAQILEFRKRAKSGKKTARKR
jgi:hypothetical protein